MWKRDRLVRFGAIAYESLSLLPLEAMSAGTPVLVNARSAVLVEHCHKSNAGLYYADRDEFVECLKLLVGDAPPRPSLRRAQARPEHGRGSRVYARGRGRGDAA
jgi:glycosyltransferase involved in cell wall biosynthesis